MLFIQNAYCFFLKGFVNKPYQINGESFALRKTNTF